MNAEIEQTVEIGMESMKERAAWIADRGTLRIVNDEMVPVTYEDELHRLVKNQIAWCQRKRREAQKSLAYFEGESDGARFVADIRLEIAEYEQMAELYKAAKKEL